MSRIFIILTTIKRHITNILFPVECLGCRKRDTELCEDCISILPPPRSLPATFMYACFSYKDTRVKKLISNIKYKKLFHSIGTIQGKLSETVLDIIEENLLNPDNIILCPIPSNVRRVRMRGFDQATLIAQAVSKQTAINFENLLVRSRNSLIQTSLNKNHRLQNIVGAFSLRNPTDLSRKTIIIFDDVITTGATVQEARKVLLKAGATKVFAVSIAH